ncbi:helix-turn-helix domain-containing protein, partial [Deinococcus aquatilis]|uniref:helix-turn-helix domain-containing protein n=1 Tax=Deinococcus aquatilis TaxID=519440 RepID=UPI0003741455
KKMNKRVGARGYSLDLRERIVAAARKEHNDQQVAETFGVDVRTVRLYVKKHEAGTLSQVKRPTGRRPRVQREHEQVLLQLLEEDLDATLEEHARRLEANTGLKISYRTVDRVFRRHGITSKKTTVANSTC